MSNLIPSSEHSRDLSVVIPAFNEEKNVPAIFDAIRSALSGYQICEVIFVDDGSTDQTAGEIKTLRKRDPIVHLIRFGRNFGQQAALLAGLEAARGAAVITLDCDLQHPPGLLPRMVDAWQGGAKVVQMVRTQSVDASVVKALSSRLFYWFANTLSETRILSGAADYQLLDRTVVDSLLQFKDRYPFVRGLVGWLGFETTTIEYIAPRRFSGTTGYTFRKMLQLSLQAVVGLSSKPLRFSFYLGLISAAFCLLYAAFAIVALMAGRTVQGWTSTIVIVTFLGALQLVSIGIVGEYLARIYDQARGTPRYVIVERSDISSRNPAK